MPRTTTARAVLGGAKVVLHPTPRHNATVTPVTRKGTLRHKCDKDKAKAPWRKREGLRNPSRSRNPYRPHRKPLFNLCGLVSKRALEGERQRQTHYRRATGRSPPWLIESAHPPDNRSCAILRVLGGNSKTDLNRARLCVTIRRFRHTCQVVKVVNRAKKPQKADAFNDVREMREEFFRAPR